MGAAQLRLVPPPGFRSASCQLPRTAAAAKQRGHEPGYHSHAASDTGSQPTLRG